MGLLTAWALVIVVGVALALYLGIGYFLTYIALFHALGVILFLLPELASSIKRLILGKGFSNQTLTGVRRRSGAFAYLVISTVAWSMVAVFALLKVNLRLVDLLR